MENANLLLQSVSATQDATIQTILLTAVQGYYQLLASQGVLDSAIVNEKSAQESLNSATARYDAGMATPSDKLQAKTAYSQAVLTRIQAEGNLSIAKGTLANTMGISPVVPYELASASVKLPDAQFNEDVEKLINIALKQRPDLLAGYVQAQAASSALAAVQDGRLPAFSLFSNYGYDNNVTTNVQSNNLSYGVSATFPIFTGFAATYRVELAAEQARMQGLRYDMLSQQVALDVYKAYQLLRTATQSVGSSFELLDSAVESEEMARGRYESGAGSILDLLNAQTDLANARQQNIQAIYNWNIAKMTLYQAAGVLNMGLAAPPPSHNGERGE